jgi:hypothetical protein
LQVSVGKEQTKPEDELLQGGALIRSNLGINPNTLTYQEWAVAYSQARWLEMERLKNMAEMLAAMFGAKNG